MPVGGARRSSGRQAGGRAGRTPGDDRSALRRLTDPEKFVVLRNGSPVPQGELLDSLGVRWGVGNWYYHLDDVHVVSPSADCLIISYRASIGGPTMLRSTSIWVRRWQICLYHETYDASSALKGAQPREPAEMAPVFKGSAGGKRGQGRRFRRRRSEDIKRWRSETTNTRSRRWPRDKRRRSCK